MYSPFAFPWKETRNIPTKERWENQGHSIVLIKERDFDLTQGRLQNLSWPQGMVDGIAYQPFSRPQQK